MKTEKYLVSYTSLSESGDRSFGRADVNISGGPLLNIKDVETIEKIIQDDLNSKEADVVLLLALNVQKFPI